MRMTLIGRTYWTVGWSLIEAVDRQLIPLLMVLLVMPIALVILRFLPPWPVSEMAHGRVRFRRNRKHHACFHRQGILF